MRLEFTVPMRVVSALNAREHHMERHRRVKAERRRVYLAIRAAKLDVPKPLLRVTLVRVGPRQLDKGDNLASSLKGARDQVACFLGVDDGGPLVDWQYQQEQGEYAVRVVIEPIGHETP